MGLFSRSFDKAGPGIDPDAPKKRSFFQFFDIFFRKFTRLIQVNLIYALTMLPTLVLVFFLAGIVSNNLLSGSGVQESIQNIATQMAESGEGDVQLYIAGISVILDLTLRLIIAFLFAVLWGMGPVTAGITYVVRNFAREEHAWVWADFKDAAKSNLKQGLAVFGLDILAFLVFCVALFFYGQAGGILGGLQYVVLVMILLYSMMHFYIYPLMVTFVLNLKDLYRNALLFTLAKLPSNLLILACLLGLHLGLVYLAVIYGGGFALMALFGILVLEAVVLLSFSAFLVNFHVYPKLKRYMLEHTEEQVKPSIHRQENGNSL